MRNVEGRNPVIELLNNNDEIEIIYLQKGLRSDKIKQISNLAKNKNIELKWLSKYNLDQKAITDNHQGVIAKTTNIRTYNLTKIINEINNTKDNALLLILDHIQDPHNFGAIIRTAYAAGVDAIIYPKDRACGITATVDKVSSGAVEHIKLVEVVNINRAIDELKENKFWITGADMEGSKKYYEHNYDGYTAIVVGHEGSGLSRLTKDKCDFLINIPMENEFSSLNVSVATGVILFEAKKQRKM